MDDFELFGGDFVLKFAYLTYVKALKLVSIVYSSFMPC